MGVSNGFIHGVGYRIYTPKCTNGSGPLPLGVFMHGGGFTLGGLDSEDILCRAFAEQATTTIVSVDYRLTPDHEHPAQLEDTLTVIEWVRQIRSSTST